MLKKSILNRDGQKIQTYVPIMCKKTHNRNYLLEMR